MLLLHLAIFSLLLSTIKTVHAQFVTCSRRTNSDDCVVAPTKRHIPNVTSYCCSNEVTGDDDRSPLQEFVGKYVGENNYTAVKIVIDPQAWPMDQIEFKFSKEGIHVANGAFKKQYDSNLTATYVISEKKSEQQKSAIIAGIVSPQMSKTTVTHEKSVDETYVRTDVGGILAFSGFEKRVNYTYSLIFAEIPREYSRYREASITHRCVRLDEYTRQWTISGCHDIIANDIIMSCSCDANQSTAFGIEMHSKLLIWTSDQKLLILVVPFILGTCCCLIFVTVVVLFTYRNRTKTRRTFIHIGICTSFLGQGVLSLLSVWILTQNPMPTYLCESIAYLKLYFAFTSALWVFMEGAFLFIKLRNAMNYTDTLTKRGMIIVSAVFWICPLVLIVGMGLWEQTLDNEILLDVAQPHAILFNRNREIKRLFPNAPLHDMNVFSKYKLCCPSYDSNTFAVVFALIVAVCCCSLIISMYVSRMVWQKSKVVAGDKKGNFARFKATAGAVVCLTCCLGLPQFVALVLYKSRVIERVYSTLVIANVITFFEGPFVVYFYFVRNTKLRRHMKLWRRRSNHDTSRSSYTM